MGLFCFCSKSENFPLIYFRQNGRLKYVWRYSWKEKKAFLANKNKKLRKSKKWDFFHLSMVVLKNSKFSYCFYSRQNGPRKLVWRYSRKKKGFLDYKKKIIEIEKLGFLQTGWSMVLVKNSKFSHCFYFEQNGPRKLVWRHSRKKKGFLDYKNKNVIEVVKLGVFQRIWSMVLVKNSKFSHGLYFRQNWKGKMFSRIF